MIGSRRVYAFNFQDANKKAVKYWRDIGTLDAYWEANLDLVAVDPLFNLYDQKWPIRTYQGQFPPAKFVFAQDYQGGRMSNQAPVNVRPILLEFEESEHFFLLFLYLPTTNRSMPKLAQNS